MYLKIKKAELIPDARGKYIKITMVGLYDSNGKWTKWVKLNDVILEELLKAKLDVVVEQFETNTIFDN